MKKVLFLFILFISSCSFAHDYFFAFAEVEYDELKGKIEVTLRVSTHDLERVLQTNKIIDKELASLDQNEINLSLIEDELEKHFSINPGDVTGKNLDFKLEGFVTQKTGIVEFYLSADLLEPAQVLDINFDLLMDEFPLQQNKLTIIYRMNKKTYVFLPNKRTNAVDLY